MKHIKPDAFEVLHEGFGFYTEKDRALFSATQANQEKSGATQTNKKTLSPLLALFIDGSFALVLFILSLFFIVKYSMLHEHLLPHLSPLAIGQGISGEALFLYLHIFQVWLCTFFLIFFLQFFILKATDGATLGRFFCRIFPERQYSWGCFFSALQEAISLGGFLSFPFVAFFPNRLPFFFWIKLNVKK